MSDEPWWGPLADMKVWYWTYAGASCGLVAGSVLFGNWDAAFAWLACFGLSVSAGLASKRAEDADAWADMISAVHGAPRTGDDTQDAAS